MSALSLLLLAPQFLVPTVTDAELAQARGGFRLPNGIDVSLTVQTQTAVNGAIVLRTVFRANEGTPTLTVYAPRAGETVGAPTATGASAAAVPTVSYDRSGGIRVTPGFAASTVTLAPSNGSDAIPAGLSEIDGAAVTDAGAISQSASGGTRTVSLNGSDLTVTHLAGNAFGSAIANSGSDRTIDTTTTVSIGLANAGPDTLGSAMFRVQDVAIEAASMRLP